MSDNREERERRNTGGYMWVGRMLGAAPGRGKGRARPHVPGWPWEATLSAQLPGGCSLGQSHATVALTTPPGRGCLCPSA